MRTAPQCPITARHVRRARFGVDAMKFVNSPLGRALRLRGLNARVVQAGETRTGDAARVKGRRLA